MVSTTIFTIAVFIVINLLIDPVSSLASLALETREVVKIFNKFADKELLLDVPGAGTPEMMNCCHGGCDNCAYSHIFDNMSSGRAKWVPLYSYRRLIDGRSHVSPWARLFSTCEADLAEGRCAPLSREEFRQRVRGLPSQLTMGPPISVPADEDVSEAVIDVLWSKLTVNNQETLSDAQMTASLIRLTGQEHGALWSDFAKSF